MSFRHLPYFRFKEGLVFFKRVADVEHIPQPLRSVLRYDERNAFGAFFYPAPEGLVPQGHLRASNGFRSQSVYQNLVVERVFVVRGALLKKTFPFFRAARYIQFVLF
jgi:hypothetical protein